jgi:hypothetical protein
VTVLSFTSFTASRGAVIVASGFSIVPGFLSLPFRALTYKCIPVDM